MKKSDLYKRIKENHSREESFDWWVKNSFRQELGISQVNENTKKLSLRNGEKTPSTVIYDNLSYVDFGGEGVKKDPISRIMEVTGNTFPEALDMFLSWEGENISEYKDFRPVKKENNSSKKQRDPYKESFLRTTILNKRKFSQRYLALRHDLFRTCSEEEMSRGEKLFSIGFSPKSEYEKDDRIFIPEFDENKIAWGSYKYNRSIKQAKGLLRKDSKRVLFGSHLIGLYPKDIIFSEGHTDVIVNVSKGLASLTTGSSTKRIEDKISLLKGRTIHDFPDLDLAGLLGATKRAIDINEWNKTCSKEDFIIHKIYWWSEWFLDKRIFQKIQEGNVPKYETYFNYMNRIPLKKGVACFHISLLEQIQRDFIEKQKIELNNNFLISNWTLLSKKPKIAGYDFIDFHEENKSSKNYKNFLEKFKFVS